MGEAQQDRRSLAAWSCAAQRCEEAIPLLEKVLADQPADAEVTYQLGLCYSGACRMHSLVSPPFAIAYLERALRVIGPDGVPELRVKTLDALGNAQRLNLRPEEALPLLEEAAALFQRLGASEDWARTEFNLGNLCCDLAGRGAPQQWDAAIRHYRNALTVRREDTDPVRFAATVLNLGTAYRESPGEDHEANLRRAIGCYSAAFRAYLGAHLRQKCADVHNNLGNAFLELSSTPRAACRNTRRALRHYALALRARTKADRPRDYAVTQLNRGQGYLRLAGCEPEGSRQSASRCFQEAMEGFLLCGDPTRASLARECLSALAGSRSG